MSTSLQRIVTALLGAPLVLYLAYLGGWPFAGLVAGIGMLGQRELYSMARQTDVHPQRAVGLGLGALVVAVILRPALWPVLLAGLLLFVAGAPVLLPKSTFLTSFTTTIAGVVYPTGLLGSLVWLREVRSAAVDGGIAFRLVLLTLLLVWATDVAAYYVGKTLGTRPLVPSISPNKTWEGTLGGLAAAAIVGVAFGVLVPNPLGWLHLAGVVAIGGGVSQLGDLLESSLKRSTDTDDSSHLLPGHGGMLDRFDAMTLAAPTICLYLDVVTGLF